MTSTATIYQTVYAYVRGEGVERLDKILDEWLITNPAQLEGMSALINLCAVLREDMRTEANKSSGKANIAKL